MKELLNASPHLFTCAQSHQGQSVSCRKAAKGTHIPIEKVEVNLAKGEQNSEDFLKRNPLGGTPVLELEDGFHLPESLAIIEYLEEKFPGGPMIGRDAETRAHIRSLERICELGVMINIMALVHATNSPLGAPPNPPIEVRARERLQGPLTRLNNLLSDDRPFISGTEATIADCTLAAALQFARFGGAEVLEGYEHIARWDAAYRARPEVKDEFFC